MNCNPTPSQLSRRRGGDRSCQGHGRSGGSGHCSQAAGADLSGRTAQPRPAGDSTLIVLAVEQDRYDRTVAELFVPTSAGEIHLNSQMVVDGYAYHYARYSGGCPNGYLLAGAEEQARSQQLGVWADPDAVKPWDYR
ncbi:MAG: thermonuclease family protein [Leptolyngbya sp. SIO1E4]|nr:thermonuclease family protein [Leptolyngbya sp. SIO1E4]